MSQSGGYRNPSRKVRNLVKDDNYMFGMAYTNNPLLPGQCKTLVNFDLKERGNVLQPRDGFKQKAQVLLEYSYNNYYIHSTGTTIVDNLDDNDTMHVPFVLAGTLEADGIKFRDSIAIIELNDGSLHTVALDAAYIENPKLRIVDTSGFELIHNTTVDHQDPTGFHASVESTVYYMCKDLTLEYLGYLYIKFEGGAYSMEIKRNTNTEITPKEAINYGYNMLDDDPFDFENLPNAIGKVQLQGVLPYDAEGNLKFNARANESIEFRLIYTYPAGATETYKVQWEIQDITSDAAPTIISPLGSSVVYNPGDEITLDITPPFKQFTVIVHLFYNAEITPSASMILPVYTMAAENKASVTNLAPTNYNLPSGNGMCSWQNRLIVWGVDNGKNILFTSEVGNAKYFPYPHGVDTFEEDIMMCVPYLNELMVFTKTKLYRLSLDIENGGFVKKAVQENLNIAPYDILSLQVIKNMVYFKSDDYYYMVVPGGMESLQLKMAPISTNIELLLDNFMVGATEILNNVHNLDYYFDLLGNLPVYTLDDYHTYLDGAAMRNVYRIKISVPEISLVRYVDFSLNYDSMLRTWSIYITESNGKRLQMYQRRATGASIYMNIYNSAATEPRLQLIDKQEKIIADTYPLGFDRTFVNYQLIDTGYRLQAPELMKRYREIQFKLNNLEQVKLNFHTQFYVDDAIRVGFFKRESVHITDPTDANYGLLYINAEYQDPKFVDPSQLYGVTALDSGNDYDTWYLDGSMFPTISVHKVRMKVSGKGYAGRLILLSTNEHAYQLLNVNWVFRQMMAR